MVVSDLILIHKTRPDGGHPIKCVCVCVVVLLLLSSVRSAEMLIKTLSVYHKYVDQWEFSFVFDGYVAMAKKIAGHL